MARGDGGDHIRATIGGVVVPGHRAGDRRVRGKSSGGACEEEGKEEGKGNELHFPTR